MSPRRVIWTGDLGGHRPCLQWTYRKACPSGSRPQSAAVTALLGGVQLRTLTRAQHQAILRLLEQGDPDSSGTRLAVARVIRGDLAAELPDLASPEFEAAWAWAEMDERRIARPRRAALPTTERQPDRARDSVREMD